ncbi:MAG: tetratricopeptide repeat protein [Lentisphaeria bacterium]|nr:tetratricopeptide repeat protein [Lentisphaeria bacterium]
MLRAVDGGRIQPPAACLEEILSHLGDDRILDAVAAARAAGPLNRWAWGKPATIAGRVLSWSGGGREGSCLHLLNRRHSPRDDHALLFHLYSYPYRQGPLAALAEVRERLAGPPVASPSLHADLWAFQGTMLMQHRDFDRAVAAMEKALELTPERPWIWNEYADLHIARDEWDQALAKLDQALSLKPWYRPSVLGKSTVLVSLGREDEAVQLLQTAHDLSQNGHYAAHLSGIFSAQDRPHAALHWLEEAWARLPCADRDMQQWHHARRADLFLLMGRVAEAREEGRLAGKGWHEKMVERLSVPGVESRRRVLLPVPFVRQHHLTCAPATLTALSRYWNHQADHLQIAEEICFDGTPWHSERRWAEQNGFIVREFRVEWENAVALLDRGLPFTLTTVEPNSAHLQAIVGYDDRSGALLIRDPSASHYREAFGREMLELYQASGPRGMLLLPAAEAARLDGLEFPDADAYDMLHRLHLALEQHDHDRARELWHAIVEAYGEHRISHMAERALAAYDRDGNHVRQAVLKLQAMFPDDANLSLARHHLSQGHVTWEESRAFLDHCVNREKTHPVFKSELAMVLSANDKTAAAAERLFRRCLRIMPSDTATLCGYADFLWRRREFAEALEVYRFCACLQEHDPSRISTYFDACRQLNRAEEGLIFLRDVFARLGNKDAGPAMALCQALDQLGREAEAWTILEQAAAMRPEDGRLLVYLVDLLISHGKYDEAERGLEAARRLCPETTYRAKRAKLADCRGDLEGALLEWRAVREQDPFAMETNEVIVRLTAEIQGIDAAIALARSWCEAHPRHLPLAQLQVEWLREDGRDEAADCLRHIIDMHPQNQWAMRELALELSRQGRFGEAVAAVEMALALSASSAANHGIHGECLQLGGRPGEAREAFRRAVALDVDFTLGMRGLLRCAQTQADKAGELDFIQGELERQIVSGDSVLTFRDLAYPLVSPEKLLARLEEANRIRPDLWQTWWVLVSQHMDMEDDAAAQRVAAAMVERFPMHARLWTLRADVAGKTGNLDGMEEALRKACVLSPTWGYPLRRLAELRDQRGAREEAETLLRQALRMSPREAPNHGILAECLWRQGKRDEAWTHMAEAVRQEPAYQFGWDRLLEWAREMGRLEQARALARELVRKRPTEPRWWSNLVDFLDAHDDAEEIEAAIAAGLRIKPDYLVLHDQRAFNLVVRGKIPEALRACAPEVYGDRPPRELRGRRAWILFRTGHGKDGAKELEALRQEEPDYEWGLRQLADYYHDTGDHEKLKPVAEQLLRLAPQDLTALGWMAEAHLKSKSRAKAMECLRRALHIEPDYHYATFRLLGLLLEDKTWDEVERLIAQIERYQPVDAVLRSRIDYYAARGKEVWLWSEVKNFVRLEDASSEHCDEVGSRLDTPEYAKTFRSLLDDTLKAGKLTNPAMASVWAKMVSPDCHKRAVRLLARAPVTAEFRARAWTRLLRQVEHSKELLLRMIYSSKGALRTETPAWGASGIALSRAGLYPDAIRWFRNWESRSGVTAQMLVDLVHALDGELGPERALPVRLHILNQFPEFGECYLQEIAVGFQWACAGRLEKARAATDAIDAGIIPEYYGFLIPLARSVIALLEPSSPPAEAIEEADRYWEDALGIWGNWKNDEGLYNHVRQARNAVRQRAPKARLSRAVSALDAAPWYVALRRFPRTVASRLKEVSFTPWLVPLIIWRLLRNLAS